MNLELFNNNKLYSRLLLCEWFFIAAQSAKTNYDKVNKQISERQESFKKRKPVLKEETPGVIEQPKKFPFFSLLFFLASFPLSIQLAWFLGWKAFDDNSIIEKIFCCLIGAVVFIVFTVVFINAFSAFVNNRRERKKSIANNQQVSKRNTEKAQAYETAIKAYEAEGAALEEWIAEEKEKSREYWNDYQLFQKAFQHATDFIYPNYRDFVCVSQFVQYVESGRCETFDGPYGCYNLFEQEMRMNIIINKLETIIERLDQLVISQRETVMALRSIETVAKKIENNTGKIAVYTALQTLATEELSKQISDLNASAEKAGASLSSIDSYYRCHH